MSWPFGPLKQNSFLLDEFGVGLLVPTIPAATPAIVDERLVDELEV